MHILQMIADGTPGGGTTHVLQILSHLNTKFSFSLITQKESYFLSQGSDLGISTFGIDFFRSRFDPTVPIRIRQIVHDLKPDAIHAHGGRAAFFCALAKLKTPLIYTVHGYHFAHKSFFLRWLAVKAERFIGRSVCQVIFISRYDLGLAHRHALLPAETPAAVIYCGIRGEDIPKANAKDLKQIGFVGRLVYQKDPLLFLDVVERLPGYRATIVGGGDLEKNISAEIKLRRLRCVILGALSHRETLQAVSKFGALVITSRWEGLPILALEAMFAGVPVVAVDAGGISEAIENGRSGIIVRSRSPEQIAEAVKQVTQDEEFRSSAITDARRRAQTFFSEGRMICEIQKIYNQTMTEV